MSKFVNLLKETSMAKERQPWLDYVRFFSIFLVILFHTPPRMPMFDDAVILNLRIPVFFCISGFLYSFDKWSGFKQYARHRAKQILIPYFTFFILFYALWLLIGRRIGGVEDQRADVLLPVWEFFLGDPKIVLKPFWYIACLFTMQIIYYGVERLVPRKWVFTACMALSFLAFCVLEITPQNSVFTHWWRPWNLGNALLFLPFYALGNSFKPLLSQLSFANAKTTILYATLGAISMIAMVKIAHIQEGDYPLYSLLRVPAGLMVIPVYFGLAKWLSQRYGKVNVIQFVVISGTVYLGMQNYCISIAKLLLNKFLYDGVIDDHAWLKFVIALLVMVAIYPFAWLIDRYCPWFIGKGKLLDKY